MTLAPKTLPFALFFPLGAVCETHFRSNSKLERHFFSGPFYFGFSRASPASCLVLPNTHLMPQSIGQGTQAMHPSEKTDASEMSQEATLSGSAEAINASGHKQELQRNFSLLNICGVGITTGNTWTAIGGSIVSPLSSFLPFPLLPSPHFCPHVASTWYKHAKENFSRTDFGCRLGRGYLQWRPRRCPL